VRYPVKDALPPININEIQKHLEKQGFHGHFASVVIANADDLFDPFDPLEKKMEIFYRFIGDTRCSYPMKGSTK
jgi:hypothetical protein